MTIYHSLEHHLAHGGYRIASPLVYLEESDWVQLRKARKAYRMGASTKLDYHVSIALILTSALSAWLELGESRIEFVDTNYKWSVAMILVKEMGASLGKPPRRCPTKTEWARTYIEYLQEEGQILR